jgi:DNA (cytosine-5)-methyltransferase 1
VLTVGSLFSGIGGIDLGLERAGMQVRWQCEIDEYASKVLAKNWPDVARFGNVRECGVHNLERVDLICGDFPCQPVSHAGKQKGQADERWLWDEFARIICELRPRYVLVENVPGLRGHGFGDILGDLAALGYDAEWESLPAAAFGAPHIRERVFVVAYAHNKGQPILSLNGEEWKWMSPRHHREDWLLREPELGGVADGIPHRVDRLRCLGNAVVPQVAEWVGRQIRAMEELIATTA